jgi:4a-hydroxytetrahydrobiopterin dehydratase
MKPLTDAELATALQGLPEWDGDDVVIHRTVTAPDFLTGLAIVQEVGLAAEAANHHPDIDIRWRKVTFALSTHDVGGKVSELDVTMAGTIDEVARKHGA